MIRAAIVGISGYGRWHLRMAMDQAGQGRLKLVAAVVINRAEEAALCDELTVQGVTIYPDFDGMIKALAGKLDLVLIPTSISQHARMTIAALRAGAHVLVEKPICGTLQQVDAIEAAAREAGRIVAVGFQDLYPSLIHHIKGRLLEGEIGRVRRIVARAHWPRPTSYFVRNGWAGRLQADGEWVLDSIVNNACAHFVMLGLFLAGSDTELAAEAVGVEGTLLRANSIETFDTASFCLKTAEGVDIEFHGTHCGERDLNPEVRVIGDRGEIVWVYEQSCTLRVSGRAAEVLPIPDQLSTRLSVLQNTIERIAGGSAFIVTPALARAHTLVVNALHTVLPVHSAPSSLRSVQVEKDETFIRLQGIDEALERAALEGLPLSSLGLPGYPPNSDVGIFPYLTHFAGPLATPAERSQPDRAPVQLG